MSEKVSRSIVLVLRESEGLSRIASLLQDQGYTVYPAADGKDGLKLISEKKPDLIILEPKLPGSSGIFILDFLRGQGSPTPVIVITSRTRILDCLDQQAVAGVVQKPVDDAKLIALVGALFDLGKASGDMAGTLDDIWEEEDRSIDEMTLPSESEISAEPSLSHHKPIALVVEDKPDMATLISDNMRLEGFDVVNASDGNKGLVAAKKVKPNVIILDSILPMMSGYQLTRLLKFDAKFREIPILMTSEHDEAINHEIAKAAGTDGFIHKPFGSKAIMDELGRVFQERERAKKEAEKKAAEKKNAEEKAKKDKAEE